MFPINFACAAGLSLGDVSDVYVLSRAFTNGSGMQELAKYAQTYGSGGHSKFEEGESLVAEPEVIPEASIPET